MCSGICFQTDIAKSMTCAETKSMYLACVGIAPHFQALLENKVKGDDYVLLFDESLNRELQKKGLFSKTLGRKQSTEQIF